MKAKSLGVALVFLICLFGSQYISGYEGGSGGGKYGTQPAAPVQDDSTENDNSDDDTTDDDWDSVNGEDAFGSIMHTTWAKIDSVSFASPAANQATRITARITPMGDEDEEVDVSRTAAIIYSVDGRPEKQVSMTAAGDNTFEADIPAQPSNAVVDFYIRVQDNFGNVTTGAFPSSPGNIYLASGVADIDNSADIVPDDMDLLDMSVGYDRENIYVSYSVQGDVSGGTMDPPYIHFYGIKFTNPDIQRNEGLMAGYLWVNLPLSQEPVGQELIAELLGQVGSLSQVGSLPEGVSQEDVDQAMESGRIVLDFGKLMSGNIVDGAVFDTQPEGTAVDGVFTGHIRKASFGVMPSGYLRVLTLTAVNVSVDLFMAKPLNCSHYLTLKTGYYSYAIP